MPVDLGTLTRVDPGQFGAVGGRDRRADRAVALSYTDVVTQTACWEERSQVCDEIRLALAEVRRRTPSAGPAWGPRGTTPRLTVRGTAAGAPPPPPPPLPPSSGAVRCRSSTAHCPQAVRQCIARVALPAAPRQWGSALQELELHCPLPPGSEAVHCRSCTAHCPQAVRQCIAGVALPTAPGQ